MSPERLASFLAGFTVSATLGSLVLASFFVRASLAARGGQVTAPAAMDVSPAIGAQAFVRDARAAPVARALVQVRDVSPVEIAGVAAVGAALAPAGAPTPAPTPPPTPPPAVAARATTVAFDITDATLAAEARMLALTNASRLEGGLVPLVLDPGVSGAARAHSAVESRYGYVYHDGPDGTARSRDAAACGTGWYGENTGKAWDWNVDRLHFEFMSEPGIPIDHRTNVMDRLFRRVGVGAVQGPDALYLTMVFCR